MDSNVQIVVINFPYFDYLLKLLPTQRYKFVFFCFFMYLKYNFLNWKYKSRENFTHYFIRLKNLHNITSRREKQETKQK